MSKSNKKIPYSNENKNTEKEEKNKSKQLENKEKTKEEKKDNSEKVIKNKDVSEKEKNNDIEEKNINIRDQKNEEKPVYSGEKIDEKSELQEEVKANGKEEDKYNTVSLKEIKEALKNKVNDRQKKNVVKEVLVNIFIAIVMVTYLIIVMMGSSNISGDIFEKDVKVMTLSILAIGIFILEVSYKKDSTKIARHGVEVLFFAGMNLCLIYVIKLHFDNLINIITYMGIGVAVYYVLKSIILSLRSVKKYKRDNNDIKEIVKKKARED